MERLGDRLASRKSIDLFARSYVLSFVGVIAFGVSMLLMAQSAHLPHFFWPILAISIACLLAAGISAVKGIVKLKAERVEFGRFRELRARAGIN